MLVYDQHPHPVGTSEDIRLVHRCNYPTFGLRYISRLPSMCLIAASAPIVLRHLIVVPSGSREADFLLTAGVVDVFDGMNVPVLNTSPNASVNGPLAEAEFMSELMRTAFGLAPRQENAHEPRLHRGSSDHNVRVVQTLPPFWQRRVETSATFRPG